MGWMDILIAILTFSRDHGMWGFPTNPISGIIYISFAMYGYVQLRERFKPRLLAYLYAFCILGALNFIMENVWLSLFYVRFHYFNVGWLTNPYLNEPWGWFINYYRNFGIIFVLYWVSREAWKYVRFTKQTILGMVTLSIFLFLDFFLTSSYAQIDWAYGLYWGFSKEIVVQGFIVSLLGKPILFYIYHSIWRTKKKTVELLDHPCLSYLKTAKPSLTLDVGCGSRPMGDVNVDLLVEGDDPHVINIQSIPNFIVSDARFLPFRKKTFTRILCFHMMEHIVDDGLVYGEFNRVSNGEIEIRVPFGFWEDIMNTIFFWRVFKEWRKKHHVRSYSKNNLKESFNNIFNHTKIVVSYGFVDFFQAVKFALFLSFKQWPNLKKVKRHTCFPFPFPYEIIALISDG